MEKWYTNKLGWFLDPAKNALKNLPPEQAFSFSMILAGMWSLSFCLYIGEVLMIAPWMLGHFAVVITAFSTWLIFRYAEKKGQDRGLAKPNKIRWDTSIKA